MLFARESDPKSAAFNAWHHITLGSLGAPAGPGAPRVSMNYFSIDKSPSPCPVVLFLLILLTVSTLGAGSPGTAPKAETQRCLTIIEMEILKTIFSCSIKSASDFKINLCLCKVSC